MMADATSTGLASSVVAFLLQVRDPKDEADPIQNIGFTTPVLARDGIKPLVKIRDFSAVLIGLESLEHDAADPHCRSGFFCVTLNSQPVRTHYRTRLKVLSDGALRSSYCPGKT